MGRVNHALLRQARDRPTDRPTANWLFSSARSQKEAARSRPTRGATRIMARGTTPLVVMMQANDCDRTTRKIGRKQVDNKSCDHLGLDRPTLCLMAAASLLLLLLLALISPTQSQSIIIDHHRQHRPVASNTTNSEQQPVRAAPLAAHFQPASLVLAQNKSINFTHVAVDELTGKIYLGATNWLFQVNGRDLRVEQALRTGPTTSDSSLARDCAPADCLNQLVQVDLAELMPQVLHHQHPAIELSAATPTSLYPNPNSPKPRFLGLGSTMHTTGSGNATGSGARGRPTLMQSVVTTQLPTTTITTTSTSSGVGPLPTTTSTTTTTTQQQIYHNNYNKLLAIDQESRSLIVCGSLNQGACRRHQLRNVANFSELIPLPVASNDEHSSTLGLVVSSHSNVARQAHLPASKQPGVLYVAATNSRLGPYREMVPAISARSLDWTSRDRSMQIIERSFTDLARIDISFELRDYYLVNYVAAFQHNDFVYFATVQRKSPLRQLEESGYTTRLARLCLNDLSFQSYTEMTLECSGPASGGGGGGGGGGGSSKHVNYNLLQDAHLMLGVAGHGDVLVGAFAQSKDHTTKSQHKSAICLFPMDKIEQKFQENIDLCYNGTIKSRNMNYIAGSVNDCPRSSGGQQTSSQNYCNEPIKLNGSVALQAEPVVSFDQELITSIQSTAAPTSPVNIQQHSQARPMLQSSRQHQVLIAGTADGRLKRLVLLVAGGQRTTALEFDSVSLVGGEQQAAVASADSAVLADMHLLPAVNPQLHLANGERHQFALIATAHKLVKVRVNSCKASRARQQQHAQSASAGNSSIVDDCLACSQLQDPFCGWCSQSASCTTRDECLQEGWSAQQAGASGTAHKASAPAAPIHWTPFDSIRCSNYQPISPKNVPLQADSSSLLVDVNVRLNLRHQQSGGGSGANHHHHQLAARLAQAQFVCHFDYLSLWTNHNSTGHLAGATTKATQARMNLHAGTVAIGCPLPVASQRPSSLTGADADHARVRLSVRLASVGGHQAHQDQEEDRAHLEQVLGMRSGRSGTGSGSLDLAHQQQQQQQQVAMDAQIERELTLYDCSANTDCRSCLSSGSLGRRWACSWCPLSSKCTFNSSHPDFGCAAGAVASTTPHSASAGGGDPSLAQIRGSQLTPSLDRAQVSVMGLAIERLNQCPAQQTVVAQRTPSSGDSSEDSSQVTSGTAVEQVASFGQGGRATSALSAVVEILLPNNVRRSVHVPLTRPIHHFQPREKRVLKLECLLELEGAKARFAARLQDSSLVVCQESLFSYQAEVATQRAQLSVILNDNQVIETTEVTIYKCHLFGVNPPALTSSVFSAAAELAAASSSSSSSPRTHGHHSSAAWASNLNDFLQLISTGANSLGGSGIAQAPNRRTSDCSLCLNIDRKYACSWCAGQCKHAEQCGAQELPASTCPPPRIDSIHPTSGPIAGGTLLTIEGSNLGSNEREIQDKILVGGEPCQLIMYSVSTRIVCKTAPSTIGPQAATVFVGNRAGVTSAHEKFHYKAVHLSDVSPRIGPVSGGTRLTLSGSNLNIGSRTQVFLDDVPCQIDTTALDTTGGGGDGSKLFACITGPYLLPSISMMRISRLKLVIDNSTHELPFPFTYQPDPIITAIEPAESFLSGGRLLLVSGQHLSSPQSIKLVVFHESRPSLSNATACVKQNDTLVTCLTPAFSRADLLAVGALASQPDDTEELQQQLAAATTNGDQQVAPGTTGNSNLAHESGGLKLKMAFLMDDVRSVRNLDEYYHHLPHYLAYHEDPTLFRLQPPVLEYREELHLPGENLLLRQLDQDMLITIGAHICPIKSITAQRVVCEPPARIAPIYEHHHESGASPLPAGAHRRATLVERPLLPVVALVGSNLRYDLGHMQYSSSQYLPPSASANANANGELPPTELASPSPNYPADFAGDPFYSQAGFTNGGMASQQQDSPVLSPMSALVIGLLGLLVAGLMLAFTFALARFRQSKAQQREYKRIQLQMGSLDCQSPGPAGSGGGASFASGLFDKIYLPSMGLGGDGGGGNQQLHHHIVGNQHHLFANGDHQPRPGSKIDYVVSQHLANGSGTSKTKPLYQFFTTGQPQVPNSFPPSPLTDISSLIGSSPAHSQRQQQQQQQHAVKLDASGQVVNHMTNQQHYNYGISLPHPPPLQTNNSSASPSHSSSGSSSGGSSGQHNQRVGTQRGPHNSSARNFNWTQDAPSTIVPYAVIEACNLTLEGKNAIKEYV